MWAARAHISNLRAVSVFACHCWVAECNGNSRWRTVSWILRTSKSSTQLRRRELLRDLRRFLSQYWTAQRLACAQSRLPARMKPLLSGG